MRRQVSNSELQNSSLIDNSNLLDPDDFVMSNTSMSLHTQSQVLGVDTSRGNILKESGMSLQEDSTVFNEKDDEQKGAPIMNKQNHEILTRQVTHDNRPSFSSEKVVKKDAGAKGEEPVRDFIICDEVLDEEMPHLNKTSSAIVNE